MHRLHKTNFVNILCTDSLYIYVLLLLLEFFEIVHICLSRHNILCYKSKTFYFINDFLDIWKDTKIWFYWYFRLSNPVSSNKENFLSPNYTYCWQLLSSWHHPEKVFHSFHQIKIYDNSWNQTQLILKANIFKQHV